MSQVFAAVWVPLQPTDTERAMDPVVVAADGDQVVVEYQWRARAPSGARFETSVLAAYHVTSGRLDQARMFYGDHAGLCRFLDEVGVAAGATSSAS